MRTVIAVKRPGRVGLAASSSETSRMATVGGRNVLNARRAKGRKKLSA